MLYPRGYQRSNKRTPQSHRQMSSKTANENMSEELLDGKSPLGARSLPRGLPWNLTLICDDRKFHVHQEVIFAHSKVFSAEVSGPFVEGITKIITIKEARPSIVARMIEFLYRRDYCDIGESPNAQGIDGEHILLDSERSRQPTNPVPRLEVNALVYFLADRYDILELRLIATAKFKMVACDSWPLAEFPLVLTAILDNTPESDDYLRAAALQICADHVKDVLTDKAWTELLAENGEVAVAIMTALDSKHNKQKALFKGKLRRLHQDLKQLMENDEKESSVDGSHSNMTRTDFLRDLMEIKKAMLKLEDDMQV